MIELIEGYYIFGGDKDYTLKRATGGTDKNGEPVYKFVGYYGSVSGAIKGCYNDLARKMIQSNTYSLDQAVQALEKIELRFEEIMPDVFKRK